MIDAEFYLETLWRLSHGIPVTLGLASLSVCAGLCLALVLTLARRARVLPLAWAARAYVFVFRGTPLLVQIYIIYYAPGQSEWIRASFVWPFLREPWWCALLSLSLVTAAYGSEVIRGGLESVPAGLIEAARALGLRPLAIMRTVQLPIALRLALPAYGNEIILMVKATSLASVITLMDVTGITYRIISETYRVTPVIVAAGLIYLGINAAIAACIDHAAENLNRRGRPA